MRKAWISGEAHLAERIAHHEQVDAPARDAQMPPYMETFLAHLRLLVGVPFDYLVPDARLLPIESVRFFYLDRSWVDRLVDGAIAVGKTGSREQAHHQARASYVSRQLDLTERQVRNLQRGRLTFDEALAQPVAGAADVVTGFVMRSKAVSGWPHMDIRAYKKVLPKDFDPNAASSTSEQLRTLRLERLAPGVMFALFQGVPRLVICEEPHQGIQFGVNDDRGALFLLRRDTGGNAIGGSAPDIDVPLRAGGRRVVHVAELRKRLEAARTGSGTPASPAMPVQNGAGAFGIGLLDRPWRQRFQGSGGQPQYHGTGRYVADFKVTLKTLDPAVKVMLKEFGKP